MGSFSAIHWIIVLAVVILIFGPGKLGNIGRDLGKSIKDFKKAMSEEDVTPKDTASVAQPLKTEQIPPAQAPRETAPPAQAAVHATADKDHSQG